MSLIKKADVKEYFAARRALRLNALHSVSQPDATGFPGVEPAETRSNAPDFVEDFVREHSSLSGPAAPVAAAGESGRKQEPIARGSRQP
jgi:hypothetical protein